MTIFPLPVWALEEIVWLRNRSSHLLKMLVIMYALGHRRDVSALLADFHRVGAPKAMSTSQNLIRANGDAKGRRDGSQGR
jgi:hypothetical protein